MANIGGFLGALGAGFSGYSTDQQLAFKQQQLAAEQQRQAILDRQGAAMNAANLAHVNAETKKLNEPDDFAGHVFDQAGNPYIVHKDGSLTPATIRAGGAGGARGGGDTTKKLGSLAEPPASAPPPITNAIPGNPHPVMPSAQASVQAPPPALPVAPPAAATPAPSGSGVGRFGPVAKPQSEIPGTPEWRDAEKYKATLAKPDNKLVKVDVPDGKGGTQSIYVPETQAAGMRAPVAAGSGGALAQRQQHYVALMQGALPHLEELSPHVNGTAIDALIKSPMLANYVADNPTKKYMVHMRNFIAGVLHEESGARLSDTQIAWGLQRYAILGGDDDELKAEKLQAARDVVAQRALNPNFVPDDAPISDEAKATFDPASPFKPAAGGKVTVGGGNADPKAEQRAAYDAAAAALTKQGIVPATKLGIRP